MFVFHWGEAVNYHLVRRGIDETITGIRRYCDVFGGGDG